MLEKVSQVRLLVVGDVMLDRYWFGEVSRISPEAPVPVVKVERQEERLGGAANVARNAASLGAVTALLSVVGDDDAGRSLGRLLEEGQIDAGLHVDTDIDTIVKLRVIGRQQQLLRIDFETPPSHEILQAKLADFERRVADADVVILSDYGKGGLTHIAEMIRIARAAAKPVLVDPKGDDWGKYAGATVMTPNRAELAGVVGRWHSETDMLQKAEKLRGELGLDALLVTRSEEGMSLLTDGHTYHQAALAREVYDVSGAGDTVIATLAVMLLAAFGVMPIEGLAIIGAVAVLATRCLDVEDAYKAVDWKILSLIFGMLAISIAMDKVGLVKLMVENVMGLLPWAGPLLMLSFIYLFTSILTEMLSNNAVAVLVTPIAIGMAQHLGVDPRAFVVAVMFAASASFATPIGYQTNTFVYNAGGYRFTDFMKVGIPLNLLLWGVATLVIPWFFPLTPL